MLSGWVGVVGSSANSLGRPSYVVMKRKREMEKKRAVRGKEEREGEGGAEERQEPFRFSKLRPKPTDRPCIYFLF
jgi:hypothetical protein